MLAAPLVGVGEFDFAEINFFVIFPASFLSLHFLFHCCNSFPHDFPVLIIDVSVNCFISIFL